MSACRNRFATSVIRVDEAIRTAAPRKNSDRPRLWGGSGVGPLRAGVIGQVPLAWQMSRRTQIRGREIGYASLPGNIATLPHCQALEGCAHAPGPPAAGAGFGRRPPSPHHPGRSEKIPGSAKNFGNELDVSDSAVTTVPLRAVRSDGRPVRPGGVAAVSFLNCLRRTPDARSVPPSFRDREFILSCFPPPDRRHIHRSG